MKFVLTACTIATVMRFTASEVYQQVDQVGIQGTWTLVSVLHEGKPLLSKDLIGTRVVITADRLSVHQPTSASEVYVYVLDPSRSPKTIDLIQKKIVASTDQTGKTILKEGKFVRPGIYQIENDNLKICVGEPENRPASFEIKKDESVIVLKREKK